jgi:nucleotidyltransferase/DNA polymerase involved in DNA repair
MQHYAALSRQKIQLSFTPLVESLDLDEAFLDVHGCETLFGPAPAIRLIVALDTHFFVKRDGAFDLQAPVEARKLVDRIIRRGGGGPSLRPVAMRRAVDHSRLPTR